MPFKIEGRVLSPDLDFFEESDEAVLWLELLSETEIVAAGSLQELLKEANELLAIFFASQLTVKGIARAAPHNKKLFNLKSGNSSTSFPSL